MTKEQLIEIFGKEINSEEEIETEVHNILKTLGVDTSYSKGYKLQDLICYFDNDDDEPKEYVLGRRFPGLEDGQWECVDFSEESNIEIRETLAEILKKDASDIEPQTYMQYVSNDNC